MDRKQLTNRLRVEHAIKNIDEVISDLKDLSFDDFKESGLICRAACFSIAQVGEQLDNIREIYSEKHPEIAWNKAKGMRNRIVHDYVQIDFKSVYETVKYDLPQLREQLEHLLNE